MVNRISTNRLKNPFKGLTILKINPTDLRFTHKRLIFCLNQKKTENTRLLPINIIK